MSAEETLPHVYAKALLDLTFEKGVAREVLAELRTFKGVLDEEERFRTFLHTPHIKQDVKRGVIERVFGAHLSDVTLNFIRVVLDKRRQRYLGGIVEAFEEGYHERMDELVVRVQTAVALESKQRVKLMGVLRKKFNKEIHLEERVNERLLGGLVLQIGDSRVDGSLKTRLQAIGARMEATRFRSEDYYEN